jgi:hypothetical protein
MPSNRRIHGFLSSKADEGRSSRVLRKEGSMAERELQRKVRHRLAIIRHAEEVTGNMTATCRYHGAAALLL